MGVLITYTTILGNATEAAYADRLHDLEHQQQLDYLLLSSDDIQRRRLKVTSAHGMDCGIALARNQRLYSGAVLSLQDDYALVVRCSDVQWLRYQAADAAAALELGYFAGNMHWAVRFAGDMLEIEIKNSLESYLQRLQPFVDNGRIRLMAQSQPEPDAQLTNTHLPVTKFTLPAQDTGHQHGAAVHHMHPEKNGPHAPAASHSHD